MNIDERIEAITQTLELVARIQQDNEKQWNRRAAKTDERIDELLHIAEIRHERITRLEGQQ